MKNISINFCLLFVFVILLLTMAVVSFNFIPAFDIYSQIMQPVGFALLMLIFCCFFFPYIKIIMQQKKKAIENEEPAKPPKPATYDALMEIILVNNATDKEYRIISDNNFGLDFAIQKNNLLVINQFTEPEYKVRDNTPYMGKGRCLNFSIINCVWKIFETPHPFEEPLQVRDYNKNETDNLK